MRKRYVITIVAFFFIMFGCGTDSNDTNITIEENPMNWKITKIQSETGANSFDYKFAKYLLLDARIGFIIGDNSGAEIYASVKDDNRPYEEKNVKTILFKTEDGGQSFKRISLGSGSLMDIVRDTKKNLFLTKENYHGTDAPRTYSVLKSTDMGSSWFEISDFETHRIRNIQFYNADRGIACIDKNETGVQVLKTDDGGTTWQELTVNTDVVAIFSLVFLNKDQLISIDNGNDSKKTMVVDFNTGDTNTVESTIPDYYHINSFFRDDVNNDLYSRVYENGSNSEPTLILYNHTKRKIKKCNLTNSEGEIVVGINNAHYFIGVLRSDNGRMYYYYSRDDGETWTKEDLPDNLADSHPVALYGYGVVWVKSIRNLYGLQVRTPGILEKYRKNN